MIQKIKIVFLAILVLNLTNIVYAVEEYNTDPTNKYMSIDMASAVIERIKVLNSSFNVTPETFANYFNEGFFENTSNTLNIDFRNINLAFNSSGTLMYIIPANNTFSNSLYYMVFETVYQSNNSAGQYYQGYIRATESINDSNSQNIAPYVQVNLNTMSFTWKTTNTTFLTLYQTGTNLNSKNTLNTENSTLTSPYIYTFLPTSSIYFLLDDYKGSTDIPKTPVFSGYHYNNYKPIEEEPEESGDTSGDIGGGTGSGGSNVELGNIEQGIGDINNNLGEIKDKIPTSGDIKDAVQQGNKSFWGEPSEEEIKAEQEENINEIKEQLTNELENNEIMGALTTAEQGFIEILQGEPRRF